MGTIIGIIIAALIIVAFFVNYPEIAFPILGVIIIIAILVIIFIIKDKMDLHNKEKRLIPIYKSNPLVQEISNLFSGSINGEAHRMLNHPINERHTPTIVGGTSIEVHNDRVYIDHVKTWTFDSDDPAKRYEDLRSKEELNAFLQAIIELVAPTINKIRRTELTVSTSISKASRDDHHSSYSIRFEISNKNYDIKKNSWEKTTSTASQVTHAQPKSETKAIYAGRPASSTTPAKAAPKAQPKKEQPKPTSGSSFDDFTDDFTDNFDEWLKKRGG